MASRSIIRIGVLGDHPAVRFAGSELEKYLRRISGGTAVRMPRDRYRAEPDTLWVGRAGAFRDVRMPEVRDPHLDDAIAIGVKDRQGIIAGANPRAVLIAAYRYLTELGCRWVRPGAEGEMVPAIPDPLARSVRVSEAPSCRHRGLAIEGACTCEHVTDLIDWLPKVGMNSYFIEYLSGYIFYNNWYSERHRAGNMGKLMPEERAEEFADRAIEEIERRDLLFHRAGHGWTCMPLGIPPALWDERIERDFGDMTRYIALYQGERALYMGIPRRTNLCYSNPEARRLVVEGIAAYAADHPEVDYLHFWLADGSNHFCECRECRKARPADFYVIMLNELGEALRSKRLPTRIVFLIYLDLLWPPERERIRNPDRFVLMFAPLHRSYYEPLDTGGLQEPLPPFVLNQLAFPPAQNLNHLAAWQEVFGGDSFVFDYRFMWTHYDDPGHMELAPVIDADIPAFAGVGLNGMISDQTQRVFLPSGFPMALLARKLWQCDLAYDEIAEDYFQAAFGPDGGRCRAYLERLSECFNPRWLSTYGPAGNGKAPAGTADRLRRVRDLIDAFRPVMEENAGLKNRCQARSWDYLLDHADLCELLSRAVEAEVGGDAAEPYWREIEEWVTEREGDIHPVFDVFLFLLSMRRKYGLQPR